MLGGVNFGEFALDVVDLSGGHASDRGIPVHAGDGDRRRAQVRFRVAVAFEAPAHAKFFSLLNDFHLVDATVARGAADAGVDVNAVIEVGVIR